VNIACIGGGPAGLYLGILVKRRAPEHDVVVFERNRPADTFGFGVVFSDATLGHLAAADPESHAEVTSRFARWDDIEVHVGGEVLRSTGHGFCGIERKALLQILQARAATLGVRVVFEREIRSLAELAAAGAAPDVIVACDGVASWVRDELAGELAPAVDVRPNKFVWLGCTVPYRAFTFVFKPTPHGLFRVHAYRYHERGSTFIVECREDTWRRAGLAGADEDATVAILEAIFADELAGHRLIKNRSIWRSFPTVRCGKWHAGNVVLMGDAAHTAHFSIGSGTKLAMEDAIALADELLGARDVEAALAGYEARRRPEVEALQAAAQASLEWFEGTERYLAMAPVQFTYSLMTRSLRVSHASVARRDPHLARGVERLLAASVGVAGDPPPPTALPLVLGDRRARGRIAVDPHAVPGEPGAAGGPTAAAALIAAAQAGAGLVVTARLATAPAGSPGVQPGLASDEDTAAWQGAVDQVHEHGALIIARLALPADAPTLEDRVAAAVQRAARAGFDAILIDPYAPAEPSRPPASPETPAKPEMPAKAPAKPEMPARPPVRPEIPATPDTPATPEIPATPELPATAELPGAPAAVLERLPAAVAAARAAWRAGGWIAAAVRDRPQTRAAVLGHAAQLVRAGADLLWVSAPGDAAHGARLAAAPLADRLRNELGVATAIESGEALLPDLDAAIGAGRADLVVVGQRPDSAGRTA
jgi:anthraniloyl-CoA monooxygenase